MRQAAVNGGRGDGRSAATSPIARACQPPDPKRVIVLRPWWRTALNDCVLTIESGTTADPETLDAFLERVQGRALAMARFATGSTDEALDLVQDAMIAFVRAYRTKPADQRAPLFFRVLNNRILDWHRKRTRRGRWWLGWMMRDQGDDADRDPSDLAIDGHTPEQATACDAFGEALERALRALPLRQRQVFLLRAWEGFDVDETAAALQIGSGSVKTHYFRALKTLRGALEDHHE